MNTGPKQAVLLEALIVLLLATVIGIGSNWKLLSNALSGNVMAKASSGAAQTAIPLPLGLMQVKELFDKKEAVIIDSRDRNTYAGGHIKGAISLPLMDADKLIPELGSSVPKNAMLVVYCSGYACEDSIELGKQLISAGYGTVYYFDGGFPAWRDARYPIAGGKQ
ncbi:rhodanese-like domain-containing protein [Geobacter sp. OR-1]|uniref:rhodanese-like domain-containing protein n=1 Tax=Geobacter sp. OR-1 TaxID=1266765 RepID=UPI0005A75A4A|nr:rhodanese-like domain-containing protein [Geobacter sp. OR-1]